MGFCIITTFCETLRNKCVKIKILKKEINVAMRHLRILRVRYVKLHKYDSPSIFHKLL